MTELWPVATITIATILTMSVWIAHQHRELDHLRRRLTAARAVQRDTAHNARKWEQWATQLEHDLADITAERDRHRHDALVARRMAAKAREGFLTHTAEHSMTQLHALLAGDLPSLPPSPFTTTEMLAITTGSPQ